MTSREKTIVRHLSEILEIPKNHLGVLVEGQQVNVFLFHAPGMLSPSDVAHAVLYTSSMFRLVGFWERRYDAPPETWEGWQLMIFKSIDED